MNAYGNKKSGVGGSSMSRSKIAQGSHIRLYDMGGELGNETRAAYGSEEHLHERNLKQAGITRTQVITVTRDATSSKTLNDDQDSLESVGKYRGTAV
jgi:hypothetical protein